MLQHRAIDQNRVGGFDNRIIPQAAQIEKKGGFFMGYFWNNAHDQQLLSEKLETSEDFRECFTKLLDLHRNYKEKGIIFIVIPVIKAKELQDGLARFFGSMLVLELEHTPENEKKVRGLIKDYQYELFLLKTKCASFFPLKQRARWKTIFYLLGISGGMLGFKIIQDENGGTSGLTQDEKMRCANIYSEARYLKKLHPYKTLDNICREELTTKYGGELLYWDKVKKWEKYAAELNQ